MISPAPPDPPEINPALWRGWGGEVGWDVGANCGQSVPHIRALFNRMLCFEPAEESFEVLAKVYSNVDDIGIRNIAVSDHDGWLDLAIRTDSINTGQLVTVGMPGERPGCATGWGELHGTRRVPCRTVDSLAREYGRPDFIKIDTEGHEYAVLRGAPSTLKRGVGLLIEFHAPELLMACQNLLVEACRYEVEIVRHPHYPENSDMWHTHGWIRATPGDS
jgi:FkbM family methyltransferase